MAQRTVQLRQYDIIPGTMDDFVAWFTADVIPMRIDYGYRVEFAYIDREANAVTWAVSLPGDEAEFSRIDEEYKVSPERAAVFEGVPKRISGSKLSFVEVLA